VPLCQVLHQPKRRSHLPRVASHSDGCRIFFSHNQGATRSVERAFNLFMKGFGYSLGNQVNKYFPRCGTRTDYALHICKVDPRDLISVLRCRSFEIMKAIVRVKAAEDFEWHMCTTASCECIWKRVAPQNWSVERRRPDCCSRLYKVEASHVRPIKRCSVLLA
jgi:hypothetical protein